MYKTNFSGHNKIWGDKKLGGTAAECPRGNGLVIGVLNLGSANRLGVHECVLGGP